LVLSRILLGVKIGVPVPAEVLVENLIDATPAPLKARRTCNDSQFLSLSHRRTEPSRDAVIRVLSMLYREWRRKMIQTIILFKKSTHRISSHLHEALDL